MAKMVEVKCKRCQQFFLAREADRKRGWGRFCSKSCKAIRQTQQTGYAGPRAYSDYDYYTADDYHADIHPFSTEALGQWEHTITFSGTKI